MSSRWPGGVINATAPTTTGGGAQDSAPGIWTLDQANPYIATQTWPGTGVPDPQFQYVTALLHGDGVNAAQNNTFLDSSSNNFTITRNGNTTQGSFSPYGPLWSNYFAGGSSALSFSTITLGSSYTIEFFVNFPTAPSSNNIVISNAIGGGGTNWIGITSSALIFSYAGTNRTFSFTPVAGTWYYIQIIGTGSTVSAYLNGSQLGTAQTGPTSFSVDIICGYPTLGFTGYISNLRLTNAANAVSATPTAPLTAITNCVLLTCQSNRFLDNSSTGATFTIGGSPSVQRFSPFQNLATYQTAKIGGSGYFDGSGDLLTAPNNAAFNIGSGDFTYETWVYILSKPSTYSWFVGYNDAATLAGSCFTFGLQGSSYLTFSGFYSSGAVDITTSSALTYNQWNHVAVSRSGSSFAVWVNGVRAATATSSVTFNSPPSSLFNIGSGAGGDSPTNGYLSDSRLLKGTCLYNPANTTYTVPTAPLTNVTNTSILTNMVNGAIYDNAMMNNLETVGNAQISTSVVKYGTGSMSFGGSSGNYLKSNPASSALYTFGTGNFTIEMWVYANTLPGTDMVLYDGRPSNGAYPCIILQGSTNKLLWYVNSTVQITSSNAVTTGTWFHLAISRVGTSTTMFVNGNQSGSIWSDSTNYLGSVTRPYIGANATNGNESFNGYIDDLRITTGYARYWFNFQPPTAPYPNYGGTLQLTYDPYFSNTTLLLNGEGTNGAQNNTFLDSSTNNFTITRNGNTTQGSFSPYGSLWSNYFGAGDTRFSVPSASNLQLGSSDFTIEGWVYNTSFGSSGSFIMGKWGYPNKSYYLGYNASNLYFGVSTDGFNDTAQLNATVSLATNTWYHIAAVRNGNTLYFYVNGNLVGSPACNYTFYSGSDPLFVGGMNGGGTSWQTFGNISNARLVIGTAVYTSNFTPSTTPLTAITNTQLLTCQSNRFIDNSSNNATISITGTPQIQRFSPFNPTAPYSTSVIGGSGYFDGTTSNLITSSAVGAIGTGDFSYEAWVYVTSASGYACIVGNDIANSTFLEFGAVRGFWWGGPEIGGGAIRYNQWVHLAICRSSGTASMFLNGTRTNTTSWTVNLTANVPIGINSYVTGSVSGFGITGYIASPRVFIGTSAYNAASTTITIPTTPPSATGATYLPAMINAGIPDLAMMNNLQTVGNAQVSTSVKKYGTGSLAFDGTGDSLLSTGTLSAAFGTGDFTIEFWLNANTTSPAYQGIIDTRPSGGASANAFLIYLDSSGTLYYFSNSTNILSYSPINTSTWIHVAVTRSSGSLRLFINGTISGSLVSNTINLTETRIIVGNTHDNYGLNGYIDDLRITKGLARYVQNFTPPTAALPTY
jgi:hypothetical protein